MTFEAAKCPTCGANIQVPKEAETAKCMFCGISLVVKEAIQKLKIEVSGQVSMAGISTAENDIARAKQGIDAGDWQMAFKMFCSAISKQADNYDAWVGCLAALTHNFRMIDFSGISFHGSNGLEAIIRNCLKYSPQEKLGYTVSLIRSTQQLIDTKIAADAESGRVHAQKVRRGWAIFMFILSAFSIAFVVQSAQFVVALLFYLVLGIVLWKPVKPEKYYNNTWIEYSKTINSIMS